MNDTLKIKKLNEDSLVPYRGSNGAAGYDLFAYSAEGYKDDEQWLVKPGEVVKVHTGIAVAIPENCFIGIYARSGLGIKSGIVPSNCVGVIDSDYRGEIIVALYNHSFNTFEFKKGDRIAQMILHEYKNISMEIVSDLDETERGAGGFGSSGR